MIFQTSSTPTRTDSVVGRIAPGHRMQSTQKRLEMMEENRITQESSVTFFQSRSWHHVPAGDLCRLHALAGRAALS